MKKFAKKIGLSLAALACVICAGAGVVISTSNSTEAYAAEISPSDFYVSGAGIRLVNDVNGRGLRFHTIITTDVYNNTVKNAKETGTLIIPAFRCDGELTLDDMNNESKNRPVQIVTYDSATGKDLWYDYTVGEEAVKRSTTYVYNIPEDFNGARFIAVSYVTDMEGNTTYTDVSPEKSMADIAYAVSDSSALTEMQKAAVEPYKVENVAVTFKLPDGSTETQTVAYGSKVTAPAYTYDENVYTLTCTDQYGKAIDLNTYEATMPATITMTLVGDSEKPWLPTTATSVANYIWRNESFVGGGDAVKADYTDEIAAPAGFSKVSKYPWTQAQNDFTTGFLNYSLNISEYSHIYFAMKVSDAAKAFIYLQGMATGYEGGDWLYVHMYQAADGTWSKDYYSADGEFTYLGKHTGITSSDNQFRNIMPWKSGVNQGSNPKKRTASDAVDVYATEILGVKKDSGSPVEPETPFTPDISADAEVIATSASSYEWGNFQLWKDSAMAAPVGYNNVKEYDWSGNDTTRTDFNTGLFNAATNISGYSDLYFAIKHVGDSTGKGIYLRGTGLSIHYTGQDWLYAHYTQAEDGTWSMASVTNAAGTFKYENCQSGVSATTLSVLLSYKDLNNSTTNAGFYPTRDSATTAATVYVTELKGVPKTGKTAVWGEKVLYSALDNSAPSKTVFGGTAAFEKVEYKKGFAVTDFAAFDLTKVPQYVELRFAMLSDSSLELNDTVKTLVAGNEEGAYSVAIDNRAENYPAMYLVTLTKTKSGWHVNLGATTSYKKGSGWVKTEGFAYDSTGTSLSEILNIFKANNKATVYVTEVRGIRCASHTPTSYVSNGDGTHNVVCSCGTVITENVTCSGGTATCTKHAVCEICGGEYGEYGEHTGGVATCTEDGVCAVCHTAYIPAHGHDLSAVAAGETATCSICGERVFNTGIPTYAVNILDHVWQSEAFNGTSETTYTTGNENYVTNKSDIAAPAGFSNVTQTSWTPDGTNNPWSAFQAIGKLNTLDLTGYSDVYLAMKAGENAKIDFSGNKFYMDGAWLYIHAHQTGMSEPDEKGNIYPLWTIKYYTADGSTTPITEKEGVTGRYLVSLLAYGGQNCTPRHMKNKVGVENPETNPAVPATAYYTNVLAVAKCDGTNHTAAYVVDNGDGTHSTVCSCGYVFETVACTPGGEASCTEASRCSVCGGVYEAALGHDLGVATCTKKATCSRCGLEAGDYAEHDVTYATGSYVGTCATCGASVFNPAIPANATTVVNYIWRNESFTGGSDAVKAEYTNEIAAPAGFSKVSKYPWTQEQTDFTTGYFNYTLNISNYSHLYFAMKVSDAEKAFIYLQGMATGYEGGDWLYVHMYQAEDGTWSKDYYSADGEFTYLGKHTGITSSDNKLQSMMPWKSGVNQGSNPKKKTASDAVDVYATEILAVTKCDGTNHTATFYTSNGNDTHKVTCGCGTVINASVSCSGGTASCASKAVCTYCHVGYGEKSGEHTLGTAANCGHGNICSVCGTEYGEPVGEHTGGTATCQAQAVCAVCGSSYGELGAHTGGVATCTETGKCSVCGEAYLSALGHTGGTATCQALAVCTRCGESYGELAAHTPEWVGEEYVCSVCHEVCDKPNTVLEKQTRSLFTNASYANGFRANVATPLTVDLSGVSSMAKTVDSVTINGTEHSGEAISLSGKTLTVKVLPKNVFGECTVIVNVIIAGKPISITVPMLVITNTITDQNSFIANRTVLRGADLTTAAKDGSIGGEGGEDTMNGDGYYMLGGDFWLKSGTAVVWGTSKVPFVGTFDGNGCKLHNLSMVNWFGSNHQDNSSSTYGTYLEGSIFGVVNGVIKNVSFTNVQQAIFGNIVHSGTGTVQDVYIQIANLQAHAHVYVPLLFARGELSAGTLKNVVIDVTGATMGTTAQTWYPAFVKGAKMENVAVYGFDSSTMSTTQGGFLYIPGNVSNTQGNNGAKYGMYVEYVGGATTGMRVVKSAFSDSFWTLVGSVTANGTTFYNVPTPKKLASGTTTTPSEGNVTGGYKFVWKDSDAGAYDAVQFICDVTGRNVDQDYGAATFSTDLNTYQLVIGDYETYKTYLADAAPETYNNRHYGVYKLSNTIFVLSESEEGLLFAAKEYCRQMFGWNQFTFGSYDDLAIVTDASITEFDVNKITNYTTELTFTSRDFGNGNGKYMSDGTATSYTKSDFGFSNGMPFTYYKDMHNALDYFEGYSSDSNYKATSRDGKTTYNQVCYFAHGNKTSFANMVAHVGGIIKAQGVSAINFMLEDNNDYCKCSTCAQFSNPSVGQTIFLNALAAWLKTNNVPVTVEFFSYNKFSPAPVLTGDDATDLANLANDFGFTYEKGTVTYDDKSTATVLKTNEGLRLWWTSHEANHSFPLEHEANAHMYKALQAWIASIGAGNIDVFLYQATYRDYFIPLNTWQYQVEWYKTFNKLGLGGHILNLGNNYNPVGAQTGFAAFKTYIDSRMMTDVNATYAEIKKEFFDENGYYGAGGPEMEKYFNELVAVYEGHKQGSDSGKDFVDVNAKGYVATMLMNSPDDTYIRQGFFNGTYMYNHLAMLNGMYSKNGMSYIYTPGSEMFVYSTETKTQTQAETLEGWYTYCKTALGQVVNADPVYATRIKAEAILPEYLYLMFQSKYTGTYDSSAPTVTMTIPTPTEGVFDNYANSKTWYQNLYADCVALGMVKPSEFYGFGDKGGTIAYYNGTFTDYYIYGNMWKNWGVTVS